MAASPLAIDRESMRSQQEIEEVMVLHGDDVWRCCCVYFLGTADAEDAYQDTFLKFAQAEATVFSDFEHRKAWLLRVCTNVCKDMLKAAARKNVSLEADDTTQGYPSVDGQVEPGSNLSMVLDAMNRLDDPPKTPLYLALYQGYTAPEIAEMMEAPVNTVYSWISRGKQTLREALS